MVGNGGGKNREDDGQLRGGGVGNDLKTSRASLNEQVCTMSLSMLTTLVGMAEAVSRGSEGQVVLWDAWDVYETAIVLVAVGERGGRELVICLSSNLPELCHCCTQQVVRRGGGTVGIVTSMKTQQL